MRKKNAYRRYLWLFFLGSGGLVLLIAVFNLLVNPYGVWNVYDAVGFNHYHTHKENFERINKPVDVMWMEPAAVFAGSSRLKFSLDPAYYTELTGTENAYNLGINGANIYEIRRMVEHAALNSSNLRHVVIGLDFMGFNGSRKPGNGFDDGQMDKRHLAKKYIAQTLFSKSAVLASWETVRLNYAEKRSYDVRLSNGMTTAEAANHYRMTPQDTFWTYTRAVREYVNDPTLYYDYQYSAQAFDDLRAIVELCAARNIVLTAYVSPLHALQLEAIAVAGDWALYENWKRQLAAIVSYYDFSGYNEITTEAFSSDRKNFWDTSHITPAVGRLVMQCILGKVSEPLPPNFVVLVNGDNVESNILRIRQERLAWCAANKPLQQYTETLAGFIEGPIAALEGKVVTENALQMRVDGIRGQRDLTKPMVVRREEKLNIWGWFSYDEAAEFVGDPLFVLVSEQSGKSYYHYAERKERDDIKGFFGNTGVSGAGFAFDCSIKALTPGTYRLYLQYAGQSQVYSTKAMPFVLQVE